MRLHENKPLFADAINAASRQKNEGGLGIKSIFIEKDYWICRSLKLMAEGDKDGKAVFKGAPVFRRHTASGHASQKISMLPLPRHGH